MTAMGTILLVEDNDDDAELTLMAFKAARITNPVVRARDGAEALDYLLGRAQHAKVFANELPSLVLLDLNLPKVSGLEVLEKIRATDRIKHLPVVVLTSSKEEKDRMAAYAHYANSYVVKPVDYERFVTASRELGLYWLVLNEPPPKRA